MFHPRPFGGIVNIFSKSPKGEQGSKNDGQPSQAQDASNTPQQGSAGSHDRTLSHQRRPLTTTGEEGSFKGFESKRPSEEFKSFQIGHTVVPTKMEPSAQLPAIEIPKNAPQMAVSQGVFEKLYLVNILFNYERLKNENRNLFADMEAPKFKFVAALPHIHQPGGIRDLGHGSREGPGGLYMHGGHSAFEHGDSGRKSMDIAPGQRRNYFDQRIQKGKEGMGFRHSREGFEPSDYNKRMDQHDTHGHRSDDHGRRRVFEEHAHRSDYRFGYDKFKSHEGPVRHDDDRALQLKGLEQYKHSGSALRSPTKPQALKSDLELPLRNVMHGGQHVERFEHRDSYRHQHESLQHRTDSLMSMSAESPGLNRVSPEVRLTESKILTTTSSASSYGVVKESSDDKLLQYTAMAAAVAASSKSSQSWTRSSEAFSWQTPTANRFETTSVKATADVFTSPVLKTGGSANQSFLERLLDKSFDSAEPNLDTAVIDAAAQFQKSLQFSTTEVSSPQPLSPINLEWQYKDPQGLVHGPFSSSQMYTWYINNFFNPNLQMRYNNKMPWMPFKDLYPINSNPFRENPMGFGVRTPKQSPVSKVLDTASDLTAVATTPAVREEERSKPHRGEDNESPVFNPRWNKQDDLKVDSLLDIMEKQKRQSVAKAVSTQKTPLNQPPKPAPGWNLAGEDPVPIASDDFPSLALGAEKSTKPKKKSGGPFQQQHNTMPLKVFMKQHASTPESSAKINPRESFASKVMGHKQ